MCDIDIWPNNPGDWSSIGLVLLEYSLNCPNMQEQGNL